MFPRLVNIGSFPLSTYGVLFAIACLVALWIAARLGARKGLDKQRVSDLGLYCALTGLAGAKLLMVLFDWRYYSSKPAELFSIATLRAAGVFQGGLVLAVLFAVWYTRKHRMPWLTTADVFAPGIAIGHAIGRLGCFAAGCCWGIACDRPWAVTYRNPEADTGVPLYQPLHPTQIYEALCEFVVFVYLYARSGRPHREGSIIAEYLILSNALRFMVEFYRYHEQALPFGGSLSLTQWISLALALTGGVILFAGHRRATIVSK